ncbi:uncharacterized protein [Watersipora subatra]|uniref:uncharacterized protein n=1 Tax=Watersipora subatra TaxID=2589382 RepID=UPI00355BA97F
MASGLIHQIQRSPPEAKTYGFQSLPPKKVDAISRRLYMTHTLVSSPLQKTQMSNSRGSRSRPNTASAFDPVTAIAGAQNKFTTQKDLEEIVHRLQRATSSSEKFAKNRNSSRTNKKKPLLSAVDTLTRDVQVLHKKIVRLSRPTTASSLKRLGFCSYCMDKDIDKEKFESQLEDELSKDLIFNAKKYSGAVTRSTTPIHASANDKHSCRKCRLKQETKIRWDKLPLLSGLSRSQTVEEITSRLYYPKHRCLQETPYSTYVP